MPIIQREVVVDGSPVRYTMIGSGEPVALVHGFCGSSLWWGRNIAALAERYQVYMIDLPGFGAMRRLRAKFALAHAAHWLHAWMDAIGLERAHFVGHSMGGYICMRLAGSWPERVNRLVLAAPAGAPTTGSIFREFLPLLTSIRYTTPAFLPTLAFDTLRTGPLTFLRVAQEIVAADVRDILLQILAPTLMIWGKHDTLVPPTDAAILSAAIPDARVHILERAGHVVMFDSPAEFNTALLAFLATSDTMPYVSTARHRAPQRESLH